MAAAGIILALAGAYLCAGVVFGVGFVVRGAARVDAAAGDAGYIVRLLWFPAAVALWPVLLMKWMRS